MTDILNYKNGLCSRQNMLGVGQQRVFAGRHWPGQVPVEAYLNAISICRSFEV